MSQPRVTIEASNPFSARCVRPGVLPYFFTEDQDTESLLKRLRDNHWWGQITGGHGSGKSTLLATLIPAIESTGRPAVLVELHDGQRRLPIDLASALGRQPAVVVVDGYEQLGRLARFRLKRFCRRHALGLVVTAHRPVGFPVLFHTEADLKTVHRLLGALAGGQAAPLWADLEECLLRHRGNVRELLFELYDRHERHRREP